MTGRESAEAVALRALGWLVAQEDLLPGFLAATGCAPSDLPARATESEFLAAVMDFLLAEDAQVMAFCDAAGLPYDLPMRARAGLPGGDLPHWT